MVGPCGNNSEGVVKMRHAGFFLMEAITYYTNIKRIGQIFIGTNNACILFK